MTEAQRGTAYALLQSGLSAKGLEKTRNVMRLNETIAEMTNKFTEYGEGLYQPDGHGRAVDDRTLGLAARGTSSHHQLLHPGGIRS